jgi:hypothetical protein
MDTNFEGAAMVRDKVDNKWIHLLRREQEGKIYLVKLHLNQSR